ncbi:WSC-domain-containing protein [Cubamyces sp. BRFM 1775]|nr:WSC-domain-containing protein [Cubamyces sp. BRFM 1775]
MFARILTFVTLAAAVNAYWTFGATPVLVQTRLDSIVSPGVVSSHVHAIVGASGFSPNYDPDQLMQSKCTTLSVQKDLSNYWAPQLYHRDQNTGQFTAIPSVFNIYYLPRPGPKNEPIKAFPKGLRMLAGDTFRRTYNASSFEEQAIDFVCLTANGGSNEAPPLPTQECVGGLRAQIFFPSCWDGVNLDSADHKSHMAYPIQAYNGGDCPASHPVHLISLFIEMEVQVQQFDWHGPGTWVFANGDTTGYGLHADFQNGWDVDLLQQAIDQCSGQSGDLLACPPLAALYDPQAAAACVYEGVVADEPTGVSSPVTDLPGCNPVYNSGQTCPSKPTPALVSVQTPLPSGWTEVGCIAEGTSGRALAALSTTAPNMSKDVCASFCASHGYTLAGAEFGDECYCDNALRNGATGAVLEWDQCANRCAGNEYENCGGSSKLTLMSHGGSVAHADKGSRRAVRFAKEDA